MGECVATRQPLRGESREVDGCDSRPRTPEGHLSNALSPEIYIGVHGEETGKRPASIDHLSASSSQPKYQSPLRHHRRTPSAHRQVKETLNARSEYTSDEQDGRSHHRINQYVIKEEIGRGSYGAVHLATDQYGNEFAVKEFSKARLRRRAKSDIIRRGPRGVRPRQPLMQLGPDDPDSTTARLQDQQSNEAKDALFLIRKETAIMKKMNHPNLVQLIEVLDDPEEDSLYMVLEMCKKGVVMKLGLDESADPYPVSSCRCWFRDLILGIEYLHAQGVVHHDIKPDNLLLTEDDVLKIVDFGVSEMFEKPDVMMTRKSAGSPAFFPPELCVAKHGGVDGKAADIWSMGVTLYCLRYGRLPFEQSNVLEMCEAIKTDTAYIPADEDPDFVDLMSRILEKDPGKRITMGELREHPWVTRGGEDRLLSVDENCSETVDLPNALELNHAFTRKMTHLLCVMKAISKFKSLVARKGTTHEPGEDLVQGRGGASDGVMDDTGETSSSAGLIAQVLKERERFLSSTAGRSGPEDEGQGQDQTALEPLLLGIGTGGHDSFVSDEPQLARVVSDSPTAVDFDVYDRAFEEEVEKIKRSTSRRAARHGAGNMYLTRHLGEEARYRSDDAVTWDAGPPRDTHQIATAQAGLTFADIVNQKMKEVSKSTQASGAQASDSEA